jgi:hypothetical protein
MEGQDGNQTQIETITFSFDWFLAPSGPITAP